MRSVRAGTTLVASLVVLLPVALFGCGKDSPLHAIGGTITGLTGSGLVLSTPGQPDIAVTPGQTEFTFANRVKYGTSYAVTVKTQPTAQTCSVARGAGIVLTTDVRIEVTCADGVWSPTGALALPRAFFAMAVLPSGKVLAAGGLVYPFSAFATAAVEIYDPSTGIWTAGHAMSEARHGACSALLPSGKVLVAGGARPTPDWTDLDTAEVYDPATDTWTATAQPMAVARFEPACVLLDSGKVLVAGGKNNAPGGTTSAELYDPGTGLFTATGAMATGRADHTATKLADGRVLVAGGATDFDFEVATASAEIYDPGTGAGEWSSAGNLPSTLVAHTATLLSSGEVLVAGGCVTYNGASACGDLARDKQATLYDSDPSPGAWSATGALARGHADHAALLLDSGDVLLVGGGYFSQSQNLTERYDSSTGHWEPGPSTPVDHGSGVRAAKLQDGRWLIAGGALPGSPEQLYTGAAEILTE